jgi:GntR family transcriptional regulator / MocR family aminotransferase
MTTTIEPMKKISATVTPLIAVDREAGRPLHRQIYDAYRSAILRGDLRSGQQVPSTRLLAEELGVSRIPVVGAYEELLSEGYFESRTGSGTFVSTSLPEKLLFTESGGAESQEERAKLRPISERSAALPLYDTSPWVRGKGAFTIGQHAYDQI